MKIFNIKNIYTYLIMLFAIVGCQDREIVTIDDQNAPVVMDLSTQSLILDSNFPSNPVLTVNWQKATYTVPVETKYDIEISANESFEGSQLLASTTQSQNYYTFTAKEMNEAAKKIGLIPYESQKMFFRITSYLGENILPQVSNVTSLLITPYVASPTYEYVDLFLIGDATAGGWDNLVSNNNLLPLLKTSDSNIYSFTGLFKVGGFKIIKEKGSWDAQFGKGTVDGQLSTDGGSGNITVPSEGYYKLTVDTNNLTYTLVKIDNPVTTYDVVSLYGTATGDTDIQLTKSTFDSHLWIATGVNLKTGVFKFRANNAWDVNWGTNAEFFGVATSNGADIPVSADWKYDVYFNDVSGNYTLIPID